MFENKKSLWVGSYGNDVKKTGWVYVLDCLGEVYYVGYAKNLHTRLQDHFSGKGGIFTEFCRPLSLLYYAKAFSYEEAALANKWRAVYGPAVVGGEKTKEDYYKNVIAAKRLSKSRLFQVSSEVEVRWPPSKKAQFAFHLL